jgi:chromosomal replication initiator protein
MSEDKYEAIWQNIWKRTKSYENIDVSQIDAFFSRLHPQAFSEGFLMLTADTEFIKTWISSHYMTVIKRALQDIYGVDFTVAIEVDPTQQAPQEPSPSQPVRKHSQSEPLLKKNQEQEEIPTPTYQPSSAEAEPTHSIDTIRAQKQEPSQIIEDQDCQPQLDNTMNSHYSFDNFVVGTSNKMAYSMAVAVAETPGRHELNPLFIYGKSGLGKTHLLRAIQNYILRNYAHLHTVYVDTMELVDDYTSAAMAGGGKAYNAFKERYENADILLVDDVQGLQNKTETLNMVFQIFNRMLDSGKQVVLSADRAPKNIDIEERYKSRFNQGGTCDIQPPKPETKLGIIRNFIKEYRETSNTPSFDIPHEVQQYIAENSSSNIRELKSAVTKVIFEMHSNNRPDITIQEVSQLLADHFSGGSMKRLSIEDIQKACENYYNVSHAELIGRKRNANITHARQIAIYLCRMLIDIPFNSVGNAFNRDHSTAMYSVKSVEEKMRESTEINEEIEILHQMILNE